MLGTLYFIVDNMMHFTFPSSAIRYLTSKFEKSTISYNFNHTG